jgi:rubredoxin
MTVIDKHRIIKDSWTFGVCGNCKQNPKKINMIKEQLVSGDPEGKYKSDSEIWVCPKCGCTRKL